MSARAPRTGFGGWGRFGLFAVLILLGVVVGWASFTTISGAVVASGSVVTAGNTRTVQHIDGGIVAAIEVDNGDRVSAGDVLVRLEDTLLRANLEIYRSRLADTLAQQARLRAEQVGDPVPDALSSPLLDADRLARSLAAQATIADARAQMQTGRIEQLEERIRQFTNQIAGVDGLAASKQEQVSFVESELESAVALNRQGLVIDSQVLGLQRSRSDLLGQLAEHASERARIENSIRDAELEILQIGRQFREQVVSELNEVETSVQELVQQLVSTERQLDRTLLRAPEDGIVHELQLFTIGGVVPPGATVLQIVPTDEALTFDMRIDPISIDQVHPGQVARIRFPAFNQRTTPELAGRVGRVSPTSVLDEASGLTYFRATLTVPPLELARLGNVDLLPGMPVEGYLQTSDRSVMSYLTRPITDQFARAFLEE